MQPNPHVGALFLPSLMLILEEMFYGQCPNRDICNDIKCSTEWAVRTSDVKLIVLVELGCMVTAYSRQFEVQGKQCVPVNYLENKGVGRCV